MNSDSSSRCKTGISNFDDILEGGFPRGSTILVTGASGSGKTILSSQFIFNGCREYKEPGIFMCLTEPVFKHLSHLKKFEFVLF